AIALLDKLGYHVIASSRRAEEEADYLHGLGADEIIDARELSKTGSLLGKERWSGAVDSVGSRTLANVLSQIKYDGARKARRGLGSFVNGPRYRETRQHDSAR